MTPLVIYTLWHPAARSAEPLAREVYRWFHAASDDLLRSGMGVPVYFRSAPGGPGQLTPTPIGTREAALNVLVVLAEAEMVADAEWRAYVAALALQAGVLVVPVALHSSAYRLPEALRRLNFVRVDERDDPPAIDDAALLARRKPRLLRQLTEVICREVAVQPTGRGRARSGDGDCHVIDTATPSPPPLTIFISHAKRDGIDVAEALRSTILNNGRFRAFFDDSDLPVGRAFAGELERAATTGSAAMIAVLTDAYAARPWCRREIGLARTPRPDPAAPGCWSVQPVLAVDHLQRAPTRGIPELGNGTVQRWNPERARETVDLLMLEVLLASYHRLRARAVPAQRARHVISWTPDLSTLLALQRAAPDLREVCHPGHALPETDAHALRAAFPQITLLTMEEAEHPNPLRDQALAGQLVGLSTGYNEDLGPLGMGREHLEEVTLRVARCVTEAGGTLAFGGLLDTAGLTETLLTLVRTLTSDDDSGDAVREPQARILSFQRWPSLPSRETIAADAGICEFVLIDSQVPPAERVVDDRRVRSPERARQHALALRAMREAISAGGARGTSGRLAPPLAARVVIGGLRVGSNGFMPGVLEEALYALEARRPVYVIGGFGGGAAVLARALFGTADGAPGSDAPELAAEFHRRHSDRFCQLAEGLQAHGELHLLHELFERLNATLRSARTDPAAALDNGLDAAQNRRLAFSSHVADVVSLLRLGLARRFSSTAEDRA